MIYPDCDMKRWSHCDNSVVLANADYYYTKEQVDKKFDDFDGVTDEEVQRMINTSIRTKADKADVNALSGQVQANTDAIENTYTKQETNAAVTAATTPINNTLTAHTADTSIHVTSAEKTYWNNKLDASAYTPTDLSNYYTKGQTDDLLDEKLDASAYTPTDLSNYYTKGQTDGLLDEKLDASAYTPTDLSNYYTKQETNGVVNGAVSGKADTTYVNQIATQATSAITELNTRIGTVETNLGGQIETLNANKFGYASYDSQTQRINFYSHSNSPDVLTYIDATAFIKDGMVSNVEIINGNLVITFNSDAGKQPISIPLTDIFNPANYYTTEQTQSYVSGFTYDKATIDQKVASGGTFDPDLYYDKTATDALLAAKADTATTYTKTEVDAALSGKADASALTAVANDVQTVSGQVQTKVSTSDFNTYTAATASAIDGKADTSAVTAVSDALTAHTANTNVHVTSAEKTAWNDKAEVIELTQAQYNALVTKDPDVLYVISDAAPAEVIISTTITSSSTNGEAASAKAVYDQMGGLKLVSLTQAQYDALSTKDASTIYFING